MDRFNKWADAQAARSGMTMMVFNFGVDGSKAAIDTNNPPVCNGCGGITTHIASDNGKEEALCAACAAVYRTQRRYLDPSYFFVLTLAEVCAVCCTLYRC
jgi:hypothetical protein